jgi:hypothetical protein
MIEEAEKNASIDKTKKALINVVYELDNLLHRIDSMRDSASVQNGPSYTSSDYFRMVTKKIRTNYKGRSFKPLATMVEGGYILNAYESMALQTLRRTVKKSLIIDISEDGD